MKLRKHLFLFCLIGLSFTGINAQQYVKPNEHSADCNGAVELTDTVVIALNTPPGAGRFIELAAGKPSAERFIQENHVVWYRWKAPADCRMSFTLIPDSPEDDYDFVLFMCGNGNCCNEIHKTPIRSCISRNDKSLSSYTGLKDGASGNHIPPGPGPSFCKPVEVSANQIFLLAVNNVYEGGKGHSLEIHYSNCTKTFVQPPVKDAIQPALSNLILSFSDKSTGKPLNANVKISGLYKDSTSERVYGVSNFLKGFTPGLNPEIVVSAQGYFSYVTSLKTSTEPKIYEIKVELIPIEVGNSAVFDNIHFYGGTANFLPSAYVALKSLLDIMIQNPTLVIEIQGHVNQPLNAAEQKKPQDLQQLSDDRAWAVKEYLMKRGIHPDRMKCKGFSNSQMIFPYATDEEEMQMNRRVEIKVLAK